MTQGCLPRTLRGRVAAQRPRGRVRISRRSVAGRCRPAGHRGSPGACHRVDARRVHSKCLALRPRIAFLSDRAGDWQIWVSDPDGGNAAQLTTMQFSSSPGFPQWSPDGKTIAFHGDPHGRPEIIIVPAAGGEPRVLTQSLPNGGYPRFSRDGRWIYFTVFDGEARVWKIPADGGEAVQVTTSPAVASIESSDGRNLFYVETANGTSAFAGACRLPAAAR